MHVKGNTTLITGGTSGIGRTLAEVSISAAIKESSPAAARALLSEITAAHPGSERG